MYFLCTLLLLATSYVASVPVPVVPGVGQETFEEFYDDEQDKLKVFFDKSNVDDDIWRWFQPMELEREQLVPNGFDIGLNPDEVPSQDRRIKMTNFYESWNNRINAEVADTVSDDVIVQIQPIPPLKSTKERRNNFFWRLLDYWI